MDSAGLVCRGAGHRTLAPGGRAVGGSIGSLGHLARHLEKTVDQDVGAGPDAERPVAPEPAPRVLIGGGGPHRSGEQRAPVVQRAHRERVHRLREPGLGEVAEVLAADLFQAMTGRQNLPTSPRAISSSGLSPRRTQPPWSMGRSTRSRNRRLFGAAGGVSPCSRCAAMSGSARSPPSTPTSGRRRPTSIRSTAISASQVRRMSASTVVATESETSYTGTKSSTSILRASFARASRSASLARARELRHGAHPRPIQARRQAGDTRRACWAGCRRGR